MQSSPSASRAATSAGPRSEAHRKAFDVVGLYGDPTVAWSIMLDVLVGRPAQPHTYRDDLAALMNDWPDTGPAAEWVVVEEADWTDALQAMATRPYVDEEPLVRGAATPDGRRLAIAAHHGVVDGFGLLALLGGAIGEKLSTGARGVTRTAEGSFVRGAVKHLASALVRPPRRFRAVDADSRRPGEWLLARDLRTGIDTATLVAACARVLRDWGSTGGRNHPMAAAIGASRRSGDRLTPDRDTVLLRLVGADFTDPAVAREELRAAVPEPDSPTTRASGVGPLVAKLLGSRLGSTVLVSNLGIVSGSTRIERMWFYPAVNGPCGVAVGTLTLDAAPTVTVRVFRRDFGQQAGERLADLVVQSIDALSDAHRRR